jgi:hypothetical protein
MQCSVAKSCFDLPSDHSLVLITLTSHALNQEKQPSGYLPASQRGGLRSSPPQAMWDLWWAKWHWGRFSLCTSASPTHSHSTDCSTLNIQHHPSPGAGTIGQRVATIPSALSLTPPYETKENPYFNVLRLWESYTLIFVYVFMARSWR